MLLNLLKSYYQTRKIKRSPISFARGLGVRVGKNCKFVSISRSTFGSEPYLVSIGDHVEFAAGVRFLPHDGGVWVFREDEPNWDVFGPIKIGSNVFIGYGVIILPGAVVEDNCVIGAGSVVRGVIPSNSVAAGVPARRIRSLQEYKNKMKEVALPTKQMNREEKRAFLVDHFNL